MSGEEERSNTFIILRVTWEDIEIELNESTSSHRIEYQNGKHAHTRYRHSNNNNQQRPHHHRSNNQGRQLYGRPVKKEIKSQLLCSRWTIHNVKYQKVDMHRQCFLAGRVIHTNREMCGRKCT